MKRAGYVLIVIKQNMKAQKETANQIAREEAEEMGLPKLAGTEKQVAWANTIRQEMIKELESRSHFKGYTEALEFMVQHKTKASWYIENRKEYRETIRDLLLAEIPTEEEIAEKEIEKDIRIESTVYPRIANTEFLPKSL